MCRLNGSNFSGDTAAIVAAANQGKLKVKKVTGGAKATGKGLVFKMNASGPNEGITLSFAEGNSCSTQVENILAKLKS